MVIKLKYTCIKCGVSFEKNVLKKTEEVMCPICGTKQKFRYKIINGMGEEEWREPDPWEDPDYWNIP